MHARAGEPEGEHGTGDGAGSGGGLHRPGHHVPSHRGVALPGGALLLLHHSLHHRLRGLYHW